LRRTTLQLPQIRLTLDRTFMTTVPSGSHGDPFNFNDPPVSPTALAHHHPRKTSGDGQSAVEKCSKMVKVRQMLAKKPLKWPCSQEEQGPLQAPHRDQRLVVRRRGVLRKLGRRRADDAMHKLERGDQCR
jgi:hypothetical protein